MLLGSKVLKKNRVILALALLFWYLDYL